MSLAAPAPITARARLKYILLLGAMLAMQPFALDPFLPAAPSIARDFAVPDSTIALTMSALTFGFALGQLIAGPLSDSLGRRRPLLLSAVVYVLAAALVLFAPNIVVFAIGRVLQGISGAAIQVVGNAVMRDLYAGAALLKMMSRVFLIQAGSWVIGPLGATLLLEIMDWRGVTAIIGAYALVVLAFAHRKLPETLPRADRADRERLGVMVRRFRNVLSDRVYLGIVLAGVANSIALFGYLTIMPVIYQGRFDLASDQYGYLFVLNSISGYVGVQVISKLSQYIPMRHLVVGIFAAQFCVGTAIAFFGTMDAPLVAVQSLLMIFVFFIAGSFTPLGTLALTRHGEEAGTAAALNMVLGSLGATLAAPIFAGLNPENTIGLGWLICGAFTLGLVSLFAVAKVRELKDL